MTEKSINPVVALAKEAIASDAEGLKALMRAAFQEVLEAEMTEALGAGKSERTERRLGHRSGYYERDLITRIGKIELRVPQDRGGRFSTELFERYARAEKALLAALAEMYVQGVSTRKVKAITEELVGHSFSASSISAIVKRLDGELERFMSTTFIDAVRACLKAGGWATKENEHERGGEFLVGVQGRLFIIEGDYQVGEPAAGWTAVGGGYLVALGHLDATAKTGRAPRSRIKGALEAAERHTAGVRGPFAIVTTGGRTAH